MIQYSEFTTENLQLLSGLSPPYFAAFGFYTAFVPSHFHIFHWSLCYFGHFHFPILLIYFVSAMDSNRALLVHFVKVMKTSTWKEKFSVLRLEVMYFLEGVTKLDISAAKSFCQILKKIADTCSKHLEKSMNAKNPDPILKQILTNQAQQILRAPWFVGTNSHQYQ